jgi:hypothetical protein
MTPLIATGRARIRERLITAEGLAAVGQVDYGLRVAGIIKR